MMDGVGMTWFDFFWMFLLWVGFLALAIWLIKLLFPLAEVHPDENRKTPLSAPESLSPGYTPSEPTAEQEQAREN